MRLACMLAAGPGSSIVVIDDNRKFVIARSTPLDAPHPAPMTAKGALSVVVLSFPRQAFVGIPTSVGLVFALGSRCWPMADVRFEARGRW